MPLTFNALQGSFGGSAMLINGTLRMDYLSAFDADAASWQDCARDSQGVGQMTIDDLRITGQDTLAVTESTHGANVMAQAKRSSPDS